MESSLIHNRVGILTSGSGAPGVNSAIYSLCKLLKKKGIEILGFKNGLAGVLKKDFETLLQIKSLTYRLPIIDSEKFESEYMNVSFFKIK